MKVVRMDPEERQPAGGDLFIGRIERQPILVDGDSDLLRASVVTFLDGAVNRMHEHTNDQILIITEGEGIVQAEGEPERLVSVGDVVFIPSGERHWHGAAPGQTMSHITIMTPGTTSM